MDSLSEDALAVIGSFCDARALDLRARVESDVVRG